LFVGIAGPVYTTSDEHAIAAPWMSPPSDMDAVQQIRIALPHVESGERFEKMHASMAMVGRGGFEPPTNGLKVRCSTS
jgi:hypothetical protein